MLWHLARIQTTARAGFTARSANRKLGPLATITTDRTTCPDDGACALRATARDGGEDHAIRIAAGERVPLRLSGCYADGGPLAWYWSRITRGDLGGTWGEMCHEVADTDLSHAVVRILQAGDLPMARPGEIDWHACAALAHALACSRARPGFTWGYTHHRPTPRLVAILDQMERICGVAMMLSANNMGHAGTLREAYPGRAISVVIAPDARPGEVALDGGERVALCPAQMTEGRAHHVTCSTCGGARGPLCARGSDGPLIGFRAHGSAIWRAADVAAGGVPRPGR